MTHEQQRIAIAKVCGWKVEQLASGWLWTHPNYSPQLNTGCPNYPTDLNDMHEAEKVLTDDDENERYCQALHDVCGADQFPSRVVIFATAAQRAEAFLRTLNLWVD